MRNFIWVAWLVCCICCINSACKDTCSCKKVPCPAYSNNLFDAWFPYDSGQAVIFTNGISTDTITMLGNKSVAYDANKGCINADNGCTMQRYFASKEINTAINVSKFNCNWFSSADWEGKNTGNNLTLFVQGFNLQTEYTAISDTGFVLDSVAGIFASQFYSTLSLGGKDFSNVQQIEYLYPNTKSEGAYKIYISKTWGLIGYEYFLSKELWVKQ